MSWQEEGEREHSPYCQALRVIRKHKVLKAWAFGFQVCLFLIKDDVLRV